VVIEDEPETVYWDADEGPVESELDLDDEDMGDPIDPTLGPPEQLGPLRWRPPLRLSVSL